MISSEHQHFVVTVWFFFLRHERAAAGEHVFRHLQIKGLGLPSSAKIDVYSVRYVSSMYVFISKIMDKVQ